MAFIATSNNTAQTRDIDTLIRSPTTPTPLAVASFGSKHSYEMSSFDTLTFDLTFTCLLFNAYFMDRTINY